MVKNNKQTQEYDLLADFKEKILNIDPVKFCENNLTLDGQPFRLTGNGYAPFRSIYYYIALKAIEKNAKPVILVKGRQVGATTMAANLTSYFMASGLFGNNKRSPMRLIHLFPTLAMAAAYTKDKLDPAISTSKPMPGMLKSNGLLKSFLEAKLDTNSPANNSMFFKKFQGGNQVWVESTGPDGDRIRGRTIDGAFFDECFPYDQHIQTIEGEYSIGKLCEIFLAGKEPPLVKTYNEFDDKFEYKKITNAWCRGARELMYVNNIRVTHNHKFLTQNGWLQAQLLFGQKIKTINGFKEVERLQALKYKEQVYDIEVEDNHNFVLGTGEIAHNCQDMHRIAIGAATKILAQAKYGFVGKGLQVYFGTPKQRNSLYYEMWKLSSQQYYHLHCESCNEYFPLYRPDVNWEDIWLYGFVVKCTHCGHEQDKNNAAERGKWIALNDSPNTEFVGYHINQLYIPTFAKETILSQKPERNPANTERIYMNEVLGEFYDGEGGTITADQIQDICGDMDRKFRGRIDPAEGIRSYAGFDWGQRGDWDQLAGKQRGQSYSCAVIITAQGPKLFNIEFATRLDTTAPEDKENVVEELFRRYNVHLGVGDIGDANDLTHILQRKYNEKFLASRALPKVSSHIKFDRDIFPKEIKFERDYYISELIGLLKEGAVRFPYQSYERIRWLVDHCSSMEIKVTMNRSGDPVRRFVKGAMPNDGFMALLNAYLAWKFDVTQGFKIQQPQWMKTDLPLKKRRIPAVVGRVTRFH